MSEFPTSDMQATQILVVSDTSASRLFYEDVVGAEFLTPPVENDFEVRCFFRDPDGHLLEISQAKPGD
ncbi:MAG: VOC family protein [Solirubrobacterales bacterium]